MVYTATIKGTEHKVTAETREQVYEAIRNLWAEAGAPQDCEVLDENGDEDKDWDLWYAVMLGEGDDDADKGSSDYNEALAMAEEYAADPEYDGREISIQAIHASNWNFENSFGNFGTEIIREGE